MKKIFLVLLIISTFSVTAAGYSAGNIGITAFATSLFQEDFAPSEFGFLGMVIKLGTITIKPSVLIYSSDTVNKDIDSSTQSDGSSSTIGASLGLFYNLNPTARLQVSIGPMVSFIQASRKSTASDSSITERDYTIMELSLRLGTEYFINKHISLFMEIGLGLTDYKYNYKYTDSSGTVASDIDRPYTQIGTIGALVGVAFYL